ncbi:MAG: hypothetical protein V3S08_08795 [Phycisphaerales bacterium]
MPGLGSCGASTRPTSATDFDVPDVCSNSWGLADFHNVPDCDDFFWSALDACETAFNPFDAPDSTYAADAYSGTVFSFIDKFSSDTGWTVTDGAGLTTGTWERGIPIGGGNIVEAGLDLVQIFTRFCDDLGCPADIDGDNTVGINDLLSLLAQWGACS